MDPIENVDANGIRWLYCKGCKVWYIWRDYSLSKFPSEHPVGVCGRCRSKRAKKMWAEKLDEQEANRLQLHRDANS